MRLVALEFPGEAHIQLDLVGVQVQQQVDRGEACSHVVQGHADPGALQFLNPLVQQFEFHLLAAFRQFQHQEVRIVLLFRQDICGFARFNGRSTGIIANQPSWLAGVLDCDASRKAARFVRFCDAFNIQILTLVDVPGFLCGTGQEYAGIIDHGAKLMFAYGEATVPKVTITVRKSYGGSHIVMSCKQLRGDMCYAWPNAEIAVMGASGAVGVLQAKAIKAIEDPAEKKAFIAEKEAEYKDLFASPYQAANRGYIDDVIEPRYTRSRIIRAFEMLQTKRLTNPLKKHSNIPL